MCGNCHAVASVDNVLTAIEVWSPCSVTIVSEVTDRGCLSHYEPASLFVVVKAADCLSGVHCVILSVRWVNRTLGKVGTRFLPRKEGTPAHVWGSPFRDSRIRPGSPFRDSRIRPGSPFRDSFLAGNSDSNIGLFSVINHLLGCWRIPIRPRLAIPAKQGREPLPRNRFFPKNLDTALYTKVHTMAYLTSLTSLVENETHSQLGTLPCPDRKNFGHRIKKLFSRVPTFGMAFHFFLK